MAHDQGVHPAGNRLPPRQPEASTRETGLEFIEPRVVRGDLAFQAPDTRVEPLGLDPGVASGAVGDIPRVQHPLDDSRLALTHHADDLLAVAVLRRRLGFEQANDRPGVSGIAEYADANSATWARADRYRV